MLEEILQETIQKLKDATTSANISKAKADSIASSYEVKLADVSSRELALAPREDELRLREGKCQVIEDVISDREKLDAERRAFSADVEKFIADHAAMDKALAEKEGMINTRDRAITEREFAVNATLGGCVQACMTDLERVWNESRPNRGLKPCSRPFTATCSIRVRNSPRSGVYGDSDLPEDSSDL